MQRAANTLEEQLLLKAIREECPWDNLSKRLQATLVSKDEWHRRLLPYIFYSLFFFFSFFLPFFSKIKIKKNKSYICRAISLSLYNLLLTSLASIFLYPFAIGLWITAYGSVFNGTPVLLVKSAGRGNIMKK